MPKDSSKYANHVLKLLATREITLSKQTILQLDFNDRAFRIEVNKALQGLGLKTTLSCKCDAGLTHKTYKLVKKINWQFPEESS